jgi:hypothetical protein
MLTLLMLGRGVGGKSWGLEQKSKENNTNNHQTYRILPSAGLFPSQGDQMPRKILLI